MFGLKGCVRSLRTNSNLSVKICGISDISTAIAAVETGADALGFVFAASPRRVAPEDARNIIEKLPPFVSKVGVFVNASPDEVSEIATFCGLTAVQLSGDEPPDYQVSIALPVIRALRVDNGISIPKLVDYRADAFLFDTYREGSYGGTGRTFDWNILKDIYIPKLIILAGGLSAANVCDAIRIVRPYAVDVSGGVETDGHKDIQKIKEFVTLAKGVLK